MTPEFPHPKISTMPLSPSYYQCFGNTYRFSARPALGRVVIWSLCSIGNLSKVEPARKSSPQRVKKS